MKNKERKSVVRIYFLNLCCNYAIRVQILMQQQYIRFAFMLLQLLLLLFYTNIHCIMMSGDIERRSTEIALHLELDLWLLLFLVC